MAEKSQLQQLENASWRAIAFPFTGTRDFGFQQEQAQHRFVFRDEQLIESLGRQNPTYRYTIPFYESIRQQGWVNLFTVEYPRFLAACLDRTASDLNDPIHGLIRAKCVSFAESLDVERQDGVSVQVEFIYSPEDDEGGAGPSNFGQIASTLEGLQASAVVFGAAVNELTPEVKAEIAAWRTESKRGELTMLQQVRAAATTVQRYKDQTRAIINSATYQLETTAAEVAQAADPELEPLRRDLNRLILGGKTVEKKLDDPSSPYRNVRTTSAIGRLAFATQQGITVEKLLELNGWLSDLMTIPAGTQVKVPKSNL